MSELDRFMSLPGDLQFGFVLIIVIALLMAAIRIYEIATEGARRRNIEEARRAALLELLKKPERKP